MKITVLSDNTAGKFCYAEHGLSFLVETENTYLFDTGASNLFLKNAEKMKVDLSEVSTVVLSHGHDDHTGGLQFIKNKTVIAHPSVFIERFRKRNGTPLGIPLSEKEYRDKCGHKFQLSSEPIQLDNTTWFLGEVLRLNDFEAKTSQFTDINNNDDFIPDDSGLAITSDKGLIVISGCAHAGICNTVEYAKKVTGQHSVYAVIGGFHLQQADEQTLRTIEYLKDQKVNKVIPSHCTMLPALSEFYKAFNFVQLKTGNTLIL